MSEIMRPLGFDKLMDWALAEYAKEGRIFGIRKEKWYQNKSGKTMEIFGHKLASPIGPAAGPNSQLAQNIVAAWLCGSRFMELKTVQRMDGAELSACVPRPCINAEDEGYNVEWSTELTVPGAFDEYVKAWVAIHVLAKELGIPGGEQVVFNMSVGYDLDGIKTEKIDKYIEGMKDASTSESFHKAIGWVSDNLARFGNFTANDLAAIPARVSDSITLSTLHGCPPQEIERIAKYLLDEKQVHTFVKCNPTLLGYETARKLLDDMGYGYIAFDDHHFKDDLQYDDAVAMLKRLMAFAQERSLSFGVKITNTFPVQITAGTLPGEEMYMSGRALFPLSINVAAKLSQAFDGKLPISYSGGADAFNIETIYKTGIRPITVATTILKPGGYERMGQLAASLEGLMADEWRGIDVDALAALARNVTAMETYRKEKRPVASRKTDVPLPVFDCFQAPCKSGGCPIQQQIPEYLRLMAEGKHDEAFKVIAIDNTAPSITGTICPHTCQDKCTRLDYDESLEIRAVKLAAAEQAQAAYVGALQAPEIKTGKTAVVVGAGPAGIAAASFLRRAGMAVTVLEKRDKPFGIVEYVIPAFRIAPESIRRDFEMAEKLGVEFRFGVEATNIAQLKKDYDYVVLATGAWKEGTPAVKEGQDLLLDALAFLEESKAKDCKLDLGKRVAVIGGGDVAMDCARAAKRAPGVEDVTIVYRRTKDFMPAAKEEIELALADGVEMVELHAPLRFCSGELCCELMVLGDWDESGRRGISGTGTEATLPFDTVICAVGARVDTTLFEAAGIGLDGRGRPQVSAMNESSLAGVYIAGDCKAGPATVVKAIADAKMIAADICHKEGLDAGFARYAAKVDQTELYDRKGVLAAACADEAACGEGCTGKDGSRCLGCESLCEVCVDVCPNRANVRIRLDGFKNSSQILHIDALCNECGNCGIFCPHDGVPYRGKFTLYSTKEDMDETVNPGFMPLPGGEISVKLEDGATFTCKPDDSRLPAPAAAVINAVINEYPHYI